MRAPNEAEEGIILLAGIAAVIYFAYQVIKAIPDPFGAGGSLLDGLKNAFNGGVLTQNQVDEQISSEASQIVTASGGTISPDAAKAQATADQNALHKQQQQDAANAPGVEPWTVIL